MIIPATRAWTHELLVAGQTFNDSPADHSVVPATIIADGSPYSAGQLVIAETDDSNVVNSGSNVGANVTARVSHMFEYTVLPGAPLLTLVQNLVNFSYLANGNLPLHRIKTYLWRASTLAWLEIAVSNSTNSPRTMAPGPETGDLTRFVDASQLLYVLLWDWEGTWQIGGGGCVHSGSQIRTSGGLVPVEELIPGQTLIAMDGGREIETPVIEITRHWPLPNRKKWDFVRIETDAGSVTLTEDHPIAGKPARDIRKGQRIPTRGRGATDVTKVSRIRERGHTFDIICNTENFLVGDIAVDVARF